MTRKEFLDTLALTTNKFSWSAPRGEEIRAYADGYRHVMCPITAVEVFVFGGETRSTAEFHGAAKRLGLPRALAEEIATAADQHSAMRQRQALRRALCRACGVTKPRKK